MMKKVSSYYMIQRIGEAKSNLRKNFFRDYPEDIFNKLTAEELLISFPNPYNVNSTVIFDDQHQSRLYNILGDDYADWIIENGVEYICRVIEHQVKNNYTYLDILKADIQIIDYTLIEFLEKDTTLDAEKILCGELDSNYKNIALIYSRNKHKKLIDTFGINKDILKVLKHQFDLGYECKKILSGLIEYSDRGYYELYKAVKINPKADLELFLEEGMTTTSSNIESLVKYYYDVKIPMKYINLTGDEETLHLLGEMLKGGYDTSVLKGLTNIQIRGIFYSLVSDSEPSKVLAMSEEKLNLIIGSKISYRYNNKFSRLPNFREKAFNESELKPVFNKKESIKTIDTANSNILDKYISYLKKTLGLVKWLSYYYNQSDKAIEEGVLSSLQNDREVLIKLIGLPLDQNFKDEEIEQVAIYYIVKITPRNLLGSLDGATDSEKVLNLIK